MNRHGMCAALATVAILAGCSSDSGGSTAAPQQIPQGDYTDAAVLRDALKAVATHVPHGRIQSATFTADSLTAQIARDGSLFQVTDDGTVTWSDVETGTQPTFSPDDVNFEALTAPVDSCDSTVKGQISGTPNGQAVGTVECGNQRPINLWGNDMREAPKDDDERTRQFFATFVHNMPEPIGTIDLQEQPEMYTYTLTVPSQQYMTVGSRGSFNRPVPASIPYPLKADSVTADQIIECRNTLAQLESARAPLSVIISADTRGEPQLIWRDVGAGIHLVTDADCKEAP